MIQACLNGRRSLDTHPALPRSPRDFAREARRAVDAGADALHLHPRSPGGAETFDAVAVAAVLNAVRAACPGVPVGGTTGLWIVGDVRERLRQVSAWTVLPDYVSVNWNEEGAADLCDLLSTKGIGIEAGLSSVADAHRLLDDGLAERCVRLLIEPEAGSVGGDLLVAQEIDVLLDAASIPTPRLLHGTDSTAWPMLQYALGRGHDIRIGLEDTLALPNGEIAPHNGALVAAAQALV